MTRTGPQKREAFRTFVPIGTRWMDNDAYGHLNNVVYYSLMDTAVNQHLIANGALDIHSSPVIGLVVATNCEYLKPIAFPATVHVGLRVGHVGSSSVRYELGMFNGDSVDSCANGHFVHVYVDRATHRPAQLPARLREVLDALRP
jgi:acyl-CoA thioester hydrolase